jgi:hypothetical protein
MALKEITSEAFRPIQETSIHELKVKERSDLPCLLGT